MADHDALVAQVRQALALSDPDLDTSVGTTTRKIIDAVMEPVAEQSLDSLMLAYQYDVDAKIGADLDDFCAQFGMTRIGATRASGVLTLTRPGAGATGQLAISVGAQFVSDTAVPVAFATVAPVLLTVGQTSVQAPVQAVNAGSIGNVAAGRVTGILTPMVTVVGCTNVDSMTGGADAETDEELRSRWKKTVFRNLAGTTDMYLGIALADVNCTGANVVGASKRYREQVQINGGVATSTADDLAYVFPDSSVLGPNIDGGVMLLRGFDYTFDPALPPTVHMIAAQYDTGLRNSDGSVVWENLDGAILDLDYEYTPKATRNDPANGITNRIDIYVAGVRATGAVQALIFSQTTRFVDTTGGKVRTLFERLDGSTPGLNNVFVPLAWGPIVTLPQTLTLSGTVYQQGQDFWIVHRKDAFGYTATSEFGIEWSAARLPPSGTSLLLDTGYTYNDVPRAVQTNIDAWRLVGIDAKVHQAVQMRLGFNLVVMYDRGTSPSTVDDSIDTAIAGLLARVGFDATLQVSDVVQTVHNVPGVDNVRFATSADDATYYAIQRYVNGAVVQTWQTGGRAIDVVFGDAEVPVFEKTIISPRAQNTFGVGA